MPKDYEALILIGGMRWRGDKYEGIRSVVNECLEKKKILAAICDAAGFLGTIGVLNNVKHTGNELEDLKKWAGENYCGELNFIPRMAVCDNKIITANGTASLEFAKEVLLTLGDIPKEIIEGWYQFHKLGCYTVDISQLMGK